MTIKEIYTAANSEQRNSVLVRIVDDGVAMSTAYAYCNGTRIPKKLYREKIRDYVGEIMHVQATTEDLFPDKEFDL